MNDAAKIGYIVCGWCEQDFRKGDMQYVGYRANNHWTYRRNPVHDSEDRISHSICPIHLEGSLKSKDLIY